MATDLKTILDDTASAIHHDPSRAAHRLSADCTLVGVHEVDVRLPGRVLKSDQPPGLGGTDAGPTPTEYALAALGSCQAMTYRIWSTKLGIRIDDVSVNVAGGIDAAGILGLGSEARPGFEQVRVTVRISGPEPRERYEQLRRAVDRHCPVLDVFTATVPVTTSISAS